MATDKNRLLLELENYRKETNKRIINPYVDVVALETLMPIVDLVSEARASYISELIELSKLDINDEEIVNKISSLKEKRKIFEELVDATNAFETLIERGYVDVKKNEV